jgi:hypothetical protein
VNTSTKFAKLSNKKLCELCKLCKRETLAPLRLKKCGKIKAKKKQLSNHKELFLKLLKVFNLLTI